MYRNDAPLVTRDGCNPSAIQQSDLLSLADNIGCQAPAVLCEPEDCFRFPQELPERFPQMSLFDT